jgi:hypothetical protein
MAAKKPKPAMTGARARQLAANPATRAALADKFLSPAQLKQRQLNQRLDTPVTPGSTLTNRQLAQQRNAAVQVQYGPQDQALGSRLAASQQTEKDQAGWYQDYLNELAQHKKNVADISANANTAYQGLSGAAQGLGTGVEGTGAQDDASKAQAVRQALLGNFGALQNAQGRNATDYADTLAKVVGPGQKLQAQAQGRRNTNAVRDQVASLGLQKGAYASKFSTDAITNEQKNVLAQQALGLDVQKAATQAAQNSPAAKAATAAATSEAQMASKYGMTVHQWRLLGPNGRATRIAATKAKPADSVYTSGPFAGKKKSEVDAMNPDQRQSTVDVYDKKHGPKTAKKPGEGPDWLTQNEMGAGLAQLGPLKSYATKAKAGQPFVPGPQAAAPRDTR